MGDFGDIEVVEEGDMLVLESNMVTGCSDEEDLVDGSDGFCD